MFSQLIEKSARPKKVKCSVPISSPFLLGADLTVNRILVDWNKNVAARLQPIPELGIGVLETNGHQNYKNWNNLVKHHPCAGTSWMDVKNGNFI